MNAATLGANAIELDLKPDDRSHGNEGNQDDGRLFIVIQLCLLELGSGSAILLHRQTLDGNDTRPQQRAGVRGLYRRHVVSRRNRWEREATDQHRDGRRESHSAAYSESRHRAANYARTG
jgi:hypothetical protein